MFSGLPTSLRGDLLIGDVDEECQAKSHHSARETVKHYHRADDHQLVAEEHADGGDRAFLMLTITDA